ncbi:zinc-binding dehydrogenase [Kribbella qitaiheensis]|uniref:Zinc-binding dehydrogenase n=1 Tax=Kribbella qitaiheensis TaxID=1544730 RepID=A0A7G6X8H8_9ACTN|nr:zinc-binding dehydrogenase [Kribbella qitaiheensis]QNE22543.1 zinc-binding dehydrogenase [Kribbella qitaiheensis]
MRAAVVTEFGGPEVVQVQEWPEPVAGEGQALVDVELTDVIWVETAIRRGAFGDHFDVSPPYVPGSSLGGRVLSVGAGVDEEWIGKTVLGRVDGFGAHAERVVVQADSLVEVPEELNLETAVAAIGDGFTALLIEHAAPDLQGKEVLITAAAGGMGLLLIQIAHQAGAHVVAAARGQAKLDLAKAQGADVVIDYTTPGWEKLVLDATLGVDVVFEGAGGKLGAAAFSTVKDGGWFSAHGAPSGGFAEYDPAEAELRGITVRGIKDVQADSQQVSKGDVIKRVLAGELVPVIDRTFGLDQLGDAHRAIENRALLGKSLLRIR